MRLLALSDLHVDHRPNRARLPALATAVNGSGADVLVVAGDISHRLPQLVEGLRAFDGLLQPKLFVAGNHDVWIDRADGDIDSWRKLDQVCDAVEALGFTPLDRRDAKIDGFTFVGSIGWYDYSFANEAFPWTREDYQRKQWRDFTHQDHHYAKWGMTDEAVVDRLLEGVRARLKAATQPVVFVSHHLPLEEVVLRKGVPGWDYFNAFMGSRRLESVLRDHGVARFVFGHSHRPLFEVAAGRWRINNPLGYPREALEPRLRPEEVD